MRNLLLLFLLLLTGWVCAEPNNSRLYINHKIGVEFAAPAGYVVVDDPNFLNKSMEAGMDQLKVDKKTALQTSKMVGMQFTALKPPKKGVAVAPNLLFVTETLPFNVPLDQYLEANAINLQKSVPGIRIVDKGKERTFGGVKWKTLEAELPGQAGVVHQRMFISVDGPRKLGRLVNLTDSAANYKTSFPELETLLNGFKFKALPAKS